MISETAFCNNYSSIWRGLTPSLDEFVRRANMDGYERYWPPLPSKTSADRRGIVNEAGFRLFAGMIGTLVPMTSDDKKFLLNASLVSSYEYVNKRSTTTDTPIFSGDEMRETVALAARLLQFFRLKKGVKVSPSFFGNGIISKCFGDVEDIDTLYEIKSGDRMARSPDFRQLAVYSALNYASRGEIYPNICIVNPRVGVVIMFESEIFCREVAGQSAVTFYQNLIDTFSSTMVST